VVSMPLLRMVCENRDENGGINAPTGTNLPIQQLGEPDVPEMLALTKLTKPGPFAKRTREMGDYFGIRVNGELIAMAGERLHLPGHTEISAVCTHPDHLGHGYATALITWLMERISNRGEQAFLHVRAENARAVALYERLGFQKRAVLHYAIMTTA
jgi:predicted GNAT family acetyltransferase